MRFFDARTDAGYQDWRRREQTKTLHSRQQKHFTRGMRGSWRTPLAVATTLGTVLLGANFVARMTAAPAVPSFDHVFVVVMENKGYSEVIGSSNAPYVNALAKANGLVSNYHAVSHPSLR